MELVEKITDLDDKMKNFITETIKKAFQEEKSDVAIVEYIKRSCEDKDEGKWNVVMGKDFGSKIVHKARKYGYFEVGEKGILIWQSG